MKPGFKSRAAALAVVAVLLCPFSSGVLADGKSAADSVSIRVGPDKLRMIVSESGGYSSMMGDDVFDKIEKEYTANTVAHLRTLSSAGITKISIDASFIGVAVEPSSTGNIELELVGTKNPSEIKIEATVKNGTLYLAASSDAKIRYICANPEKRVNTVVLRVPAQKHKYKLVECAAKTAVVCLSELGAPIKGETTRGILAVVDTAIVSDCTLKSQSGPVLIKGDKIGGKMRLTTENGAVRVTGGQITGELNLRAVNGSVGVEAESLSAAELTAENGMVGVDAGELNGNVTAATVNGEVYVNLRKQPSNLTLDVKRGSNGILTLPSGWKGSERLGSGTPTLKMSCENGKTELHFGQGRDW